MAMRLTFHGGAGTVTGSNFLVESEGAKVLVDCGLEQGRDFSVETMYGPFPYEASSIDALVVTHAHLDHVGRIPKLCREGFVGAIYSTPATRDLAELIMRDSVGILAQEAERLGRAPLYEERDVEAALSYWRGLEYHQEQEVAPGISAYLRTTGHILGSASVQLTDKDGVRLVLTGDIGNSPSPLLPDWEPIKDADVILMESVYGDRLHPQGAERVGLLRGKLLAAINRGGTLLIPAFSLERTQLMLYELSNFFAAGELPRVPVFLDSPLAIKITAAYEKWGPAYFKPAAEEEMKREVSLFEFPFLKKTMSRAESDAIAEVPGPKIIIAGAGMSHGGRIGRHETKYLPDPKSTIFTVGYQAPGSPGRLISEGARSVRINGAEVVLRAQSDVLGGWSAHADRDELLTFAEAALPSAKTIFVAIGEPASERFLAQRIHDYLGGNAVVPEQGTTWQVDKTGAKKL